MIVFVIRGLHTIELYDIRMNVFQIIWHLINNIYISKAINLKKYMSLMLIKATWKIDTLFSFGCIALPFKR